MTSIPGKVFAGIAIVIIFATTPLYGQTPVATKDIIIVPDDHGRPARCVAKDGSDTEIDRKICDKALAQVREKLATGQSTGSVASTPIDPNVPMEVTQTLYPESVTEIDVTVDPEGKVAGCKLTEQKPDGGYDPCAGYPVGRKIGNGTLRNGKPIRSHVIMRMSTRTSFE